MINEQHLPPCPICTREAARDYRPFCSRRCSDIDLGKWLTEAYRTPAAAADGPEETADPGENR